MHLDTGISLACAADDMARREDIDADAKRAERDRHNARLRDEHALSAAIDRLGVRIAEWRAEQAENLEKNRLIEGLIREAERDLAGLTKGRVA